MFSILSFKQREYNIKLRNIPSRGKGRIIFESVGESAIRGEKKKRRYEFVVIILLPGKPTQTINDDVENGILSCAHTV